MPCARIATCCDCGRRAALVPGAKRPGPRDATRATRAPLARIPFSDDFRSLNVSTAPAEALSAAQHR